MFDQATWILGTMWVTSSAQTQRTAPDSISAPGTGSAPVFPANQPASGAQPTCFCQVGFLGLGSDVTAMSVPRSAQEKKPPLLTGMFDFEQSDFWIRSQKKEALCESLER